MVFLAAIADLYSLILLAAVILSWVPTARTSSVVRFLRTVTDPVLEPLRRVLPNTGGIDFSPLVVLLILQLLRSALRGVG